MAGCTARKVKDKVRRQKIEPTFDGSCPTGCGKTQFIHNTRYTLEPYIIMVCYQQRLGCSKRPFSKAAASEEARRTLRYVEPLSDLAPLADTSILLMPHGHRFRWKGTSVRMTRSLKQGRLEEQRVGCAGCFATNGREESPGSRRSPRCRVPFPEFLRCSRARIP